MREEIELERLRISPFWPIARPLPWPTAGQLARAQETGLIEPVTARPLAGASAVDHEILAGLKNWLLAQRLGARTVPVLIRDVTDTVARSWVEADAGDPKRDPIAIARAIGERVERGASVAAAGREFGLSRTDAAHRLRLLRLAPDVMERVASGELAPGTARALVGLTGIEQRALAARIVREKLTSRQAEVLAKRLKSVSTAPDAPLEDPVAAPAPKDPDQVRLERQLTDLLGTGVTLRYPSAGAGQLVIEFADLDILDGVLERLGWVDVG
ncbi:MAG: ParB N-terminal domain-containing protein [bacterium]|nr:ParB N-terminal domain-containing protein [bacterium]